MKKWLLVQDSEERSRHGFGYGMETTIFEAENKEKAIRKCLALVRLEDTIESFLSGEMDEDDVYDCMYDRFPVIAHFQSDDSPVVNVMLYEINDVIDLGPIIKESKIKLEDAFDQINNKEKEVREREEYERLKKKYECV